jgi:hypothetical protein
MSDHPLGADSYNPDASPTEVPDLGVPGNGNGVKAPWTSFWRRTSGSPRSRARGTPGPTSRRRSSS